MHEDRSDERVGREREEGSGLLDPAQVRERQQDDESDGHDDRVLATAGNADEIATTPAVTDTETVRT